MLSKILTLHITNTYLNFLFVEKKWGQIIKVLSWQKQIPHYIHDNDNDSNLVDEQSSDTESNQKTPDIGEIIKSELQNRKLQYDCLLVSFLPENYFLRFLNFPFGDKNKISRILPQELEDVLPFDLDNFYYDFMLTTTRQHEGYQVLTLGIKKQEIDELLNNLALLSTIPLLIDTPFAPLISLCSKMEEPRPEQYILLHFEPEYTLLLCMAKNTLRDGYALQWKIQANSHWVHPPVAGNHQFQPYSGDQIADQNNNPDYNLLISELKALFLKLDNNMPDFNVEQIILSGQYTQHLSTTIEHELSIPVQTITQVEFASSLMQHFSRDDIARFAPNIGLISGFGQKPKLFNFNPNKVQFSHFYKYKDNLKSIIISLAIVLTIFSISYIYHIRLKEDKLNQIYSKMNEIVVRNFHHIHGKLTPAQYISLFKEKIQSLKSLNMDTESATKKKIVEALNSISSQIAASLNVQLKSFTADQRHIRLQGTADSFRTVDQIKTSLENIDMFKKVEIKGAKTDTKGQVAFTLLITGE